MLTDLMGHFQINKQDSIRGSFYDVFFKCPIHEIQHVLSKICRTDFFCFKPLIFCFLSYIYNICIFNFPSLIFPKPFQLLVTVFSTPSLSVCFYVGPVPPASLPPLRKLFTILFPLLSHLASFSTHGEAQSLHLPPTDPGCQSFSHLEIPMGVLEAPALAACDHFQHGSTQSRGMGARKSSGLPPTTPPVPPALQTLLQDVCIFRVSPTRGTTCPPGSTRTRRFSLV